ncbi:acetyltransferase [Patulibacter sp. SYSU D01012]|uniref:acetyltransferase n=1 Tax=Patulibacter sp. SYSU D01012 TaxID=2817381 RepID=UPI001B3004E5|nr:acetyltransferase [Patulibacter sp. SYSU D01012]
MSYRPVRPATPADLDALAAVWRRAVEATHDFLTPADIAFLEPRVREQYLPALEVLIAEEAGGRPLGFIGMDGAAIEMLFVDPDEHGRGVGTRLLDAVADRAPLTVDVNEQNPAAHGFYRARGFVETGRSPLDGEGRPFPLVHLRRER